ncbi:MAG: glutamine amidotransferase [Actinomycetia bacterium]|nr:glutamine amidotransferase [Actinomycetes bacterium]
MRIEIVQLYPAEMNIYGDHGNAQVLRARAELYGIEVVTRSYEVGCDASMLEGADLLLGGGGQDAGQAGVADDLGRVAACLRERAEAGVPMLMVCGMYQLFGRWFKTVEGAELGGIGVFDATTTGGTSRLIGNAVVDTDWGRLVGYENHSGLTSLGAGQAGFGRVVQGAGNNGRDGVEGARAGNVIGTYLHGPLLPKNPRLADALLRVAVARGSSGRSNVQLTSLDDDAPVLAPRDDAAAGVLARWDDLAARAGAAAAARPR